MRVFDRGDHLLQRGTIYGAHRMSGGTIYDDTSGPGGPFCVGGPVNSLHPSAMVARAHASHDRFASTISNPVVIVFM